MSTLRVDTITSLASGSVAITPTSRGVADGLASLDSTGKIPAAQLRSPYTIEAAANAAARNALTVITAEIAVRQVRLTDTGVIYVPNAAGTGSGIWMEFNSVGTASTSAAGVVELVDSADVDTDALKALTIAEFLRRLGPYRNALASAQGLVCSGAVAGANATLVTALGTGDFSIAFDVDVPATAPVGGAAFFHLAATRAAASASDLNIGLSSVDTLRMTFRSADTLSERTVEFPAFSATYGGQRVHGVFTRTGATIALKLNDVTVTLTATTVGGSPPAWSASIPGTLLTLGQFGDSYPWTGFVAAKLYNYVLSTAQQTRLFRTGAVSAADLNTVYNDANAASLGNPIGAGQSMINGANSTFASDTGWWAKTGSTISAGAAHLTVGTNLKRLALLKIGCRYTLTFDVTNWSINPVVDDGVTALYHVTSNGSKSVTFTAATTDLFFSANSGTMDLDNVLLTPLGALIAPEANAPGNGLVWNDVSGNRAHIILPTAGVSWSLPSSQQIVIEATTNTATNQLLGAASLIDTNKQWRIQSWTVNCSTGTPTISLGNASAGAQYVSGAVLASGNNDITLLSRFPSTANLWCVSTTTATLIHRIVLVPAN